MPIDKDTLLSWLGDGGLPLEYEAARHFRGAGFRAEQGQHYQDPMADGPKTREADVVAHLLLSDQAVAVNAIVECKSARDKPWVVLTTDVRANEPWHPISTRRVREAHERRPGLLSSALPLTRPYGFSVIEAKQPRRGGQDQLHQSERHPRDTRDRAHDALEQVVSASVGLLPADGTVFHLPVVITDAPLWVLAPDPHGELDASEVEWYRIRWHGAQAHPMPTIVDVVARSALASRAQSLRHELADASEAIVEALSGEPPFSTVA